MKEIKLRVNEIFYSVQGEGANAGMPAIFVRLAGCNLKCPFCDTRHKQYREITIAKIMKEIDICNPFCDTIIWTGGEPTLQLNNKILERFWFENYRNYIETNGANPVPDCIDYIACSPKVPVGLLNKNFKKVNEFRYAIKTGDELPEIDLLPEADDYYISPIDVTKENIDYCLNLIFYNPEWKLSVQIHKLLNIR